jgi:hypothetical protein
MPDCYSFDETAWLAIKKQICKDGMDTVTVKIRQSCVCCLATGKQKEERSYGRGPASFE